MRICAAPVLLIAFAVPASAETIAVTMAGKTYHPAKIQARVGDTLVFNNDDTVNHWVFVATRNYAFDLGNQKSGEVRRYNVRQAGTFEIESVLHEAMTATVEVKP